MNNMVPFDLHCDAQNLNPTCSDQNSHDSHGDGRSPMLDPTGKPDVKQPKYGYPCAPQVAVDYPQGAQVLDHLQEWFSSVVDHGCWSQDRNHENERDPH